MIEERKNFFREYSRYLREEPVFDGKNYRVEIKNDYWVSDSRGGGGGHYIIYATNLLNDSDWAYITSVFVSFDFLSMIGYPSDIVDLIKNLRNATSCEIDELAIEVKRQMEYALEGGYFDA